MLIAHPTYRIKVHDDGQIVGCSGRVLQPFPGTDGRLRVTLYLGPQRWKQISVHVLVCEAFHGLRPPGKEVAHDDGDFLNNAASNLAWKTHIENEADKLRHGTRLLGERHHQAKITDDDVRAIRAARAQTPPVLIRELAGIYKISLRQVARVVRGESWGHVDA